MPRTFAFTKPGGGVPSLPIDMLSLHQHTAVTTVELPRGPGADPGDTNFETLVGVTHLLDQAQQAVPIVLAARPPLQDLSFEVRRPTVWVATLRKLKTIVRCALPGDIVLVVRRRTVPDFYNPSDFDFAVPPGALIDMLMSARWLSMIQMTAIERMRMQQELLSGGGDIYQVRPGSYFSHHMGQANKDLTRMSLVKGVVHFYKITVAPSASHRDKGDLVYALSQRYAPVYKRHCVHIEDMFLDGGDRLIFTAQRQMSPLQTGRVVVDTETNARGVKFYAWTRRDVTLFNDQMIDPRELAIMGQHDASYVLHHLGFPLGSATDEYLAKLCVSMKYLMRKGWGHLRARDKDDFVSMVGDIPTKQRQIDASLTRIQELDTRDPTHAPVPPEFPMPRDYSRIRRARGSHGTAPQREYLLTENL